MKTTFTPTKSTQTFGAINVSPKLEKKLGEVFTYNVNKVISSNENLQVFAKKHDVYFNAKKFLGKNNNTEGLVNLYLSPMGKSQNIITRLIQTITGKTIKGSTQNPFEIPQLTDTLVKQYRETHGLKELLAAEKAAEKASAKMSEKTMFIA